MKIRILIRVTNKSYSMYFKPGNHNLEIYRRFEGVAMLPYRGRISTQIMYASPKGAITALKRIFKRLDLEWPEDVK